jgi:hypothetical protein
VNRLFGMVAAVCVVAEWIRNIQYLAKLQCGNLFVFFSQLSFYKVRFLPTVCHFSLGTYDPCLQCPAACGITVQNFMYLLVDSIHSFLLVPLMMLFSCVSYTAFNGTKILTIIKFIMMWKGAVRA